MQKSDILGMLEYSQPAYNCILTHIQNPTIFTKIYDYSKQTYFNLNKYSELSQSFKMDFL